MSNTKKIKVKKPKQEEKVDSLTLMIRDTLKSMGRSVNPVQEKMLVQMFKMIAVGGVAILIDFVIYFIVYHFFLEPIFANLISFAISLIYHYYASYKYIFEKKNLRQESIKFLGISVLGLVFTEFMIWMLVMKLSWNAMLVKLLAVLLIITFKIIIKRILSKKNA